MGRFLNALFILLYHQFAWAYDLVAWTVSLGRWQAWGETILPLVPPGRILEIGFGPGHLQVKLRQRGWMAWGIDESAAMNAQARRRLYRYGLSSGLIRGLAEALPCGSAYFDGVIATFPAPFVFKEETALEIERVLKPGGRFIALVAYRPSGAQLTDRLIRALFTLTGQLPPRNVDPRGFLQAYITAGLNVQFGWHNEIGGEMLVIEAIKP